jgi:microcystin-dependent protein
MTGIKTAAVLTFGTALAPQSASAQDFYLGQLVPVGFNFCQRSTAAANGQILAISQFSALFSLLGTTYGGDGRTTFALPDLRGRFPMHQGTGPGLTPRSMGQRGGAEAVVMTEAQLPAHNHLVVAVNQTGDKGGPVTDLLAKASDGSKNYHDGPADSRMDPSMLSSTGGGQAIQVMNPYLVMNWCIATEGLFPSRS